MRAPEADRVRLLHILDAIQELEEHASTVTEDVLDHDAMLRYADPHPRAQASGRGNPALGARVSLSSWMARQVRVSGGDR